MPSSAEFYSQCFGNSLLLVNFIPDTNLLLRRYISSVFYYPSSSSVLVIVCVPHQHIASKVLKEGDKRNKPNIFVLYNEKRSQGKYERNFYHLCWHNVSIDENLSLIITVNDQTYEWSLKEVFAKPEGVAVTLLKKGDKIILTLSYRKYKSGDSRVNKP
ncbi:hypothetical protein C1646_669431 [Rhizophagus diaphanus]|nr:hypothetical protein C1646_669431 [Rhizophagus diaphanus] [Rhizophagus sp. MUCL 43196]